VERLADGCYVAWERRGDGGARPLRFPPTEDGLMHAKLQADRTAHPDGCGGAPCGDWTDFPSIKDDAP
jgi:hypothetical protein